MNLALRVKYQRLRIEHPDWQASWLIRAAREELRTKYLTKLPYTDQSTEIEVPGLGVLRFMVHPQDDHDPLDSDGQILQWRAYPDYPADAKGVMSLGQHLGDGWYSLAHTDRYKVYCIKFTEAGGGTLEGRREYHRIQNKLGRHEAHRRAQRSIQSECEYWREIAVGEKAFVGLGVYLRVGNDRGFNDDIIAEEECWGYEYDDTSYCLGELNAWAESIVADQWKKRYGGDCPKPGEDTARYRRAMKAYETALITSDGDRTIADPVFTATYKDKHNAQTKRH